MKKVIIIATIAVLGLILLIKSDILSSLLLFILVGAIPGTSYSVPSTFMLLAIISISWLLILRIITIESVRVIKSKRSVKRGYSQV